MCCFALVSSFYIFDLFPSGAQKASSGPSKRSKKALLIASGPAVSAPLTDNTLKVSTMQRSDVENINHLSYVESSFYRVPCTVDTRTLQIQLDRRTTRIVPPTDKQAFRGNDRLYVDTRRTKSAVLLVRCRSCKDGRSLAGNKIVDGDGIEHGKGFGPAQLLHQNYVANIRLRRQLRRWEWLQ